MSDSVQPQRRQLTRLAVPGILQARTPEWVAISFSNAWKWKVKVKSLSRVWLLATPWTAAYQAPLPMGFSRQEYWSGLPLPSPEGKLWQTYKPRQHIKKQKHHFANKGPYSQSCGFSSSRVRIWELDHKEGWAPRINAFKLCAGEDSWESLGQQGNQTSQS